VTPQLDGTNPKESPLCFSFVLFLIQYQLVAATAPLSLQNLMQLL